MSFLALAWASKLKVARPADKLVLLAYAERHNDETGYAYPSVAWLVEFSSLDRKTVLASVDRLVEAGLLTDTGKRAGATRQIKVYSVNVETVPKTEQSQNRNSPVFPREQSQKRDTDTVRNLSLSEANASSRDARPKARPSRRAPEGWEPKPSTIEALTAEGYGPGELERALSMVRDHEFAKPKTDWDAAYRNWVRRDPPARARHDRPDNQDRQSARREDRLGRMLAGAQRAVGQ